MFTRGDIDKHIVYGDERTGQQRKDNKWLMWGHGLQYYVVSWKDGKPFYIAEDCRKEDRRKEKP